MPSPAAGGRRCTLGRRTSPRVLHARDAIAHHRPWPGRPPGRSVPADDLYARVCSFIHWATAPLQYVDGSTGLRVDQDRGISMAARFRRIGPAAVPAAPSASAGETTEPVGNHLARHARKRGGWRHKFGNAAPESLVLRPAADGQNDQPGTETTRSSGSISSRYVPGRSVKGCCPFLMPQPNSES